MMRFIADTSFVVALINADDNYHHLAKQLYRTAKEIVLPQITLAETAYFVQARSGVVAWALFLTRLPQSKFTLECPNTRDLLRTADILKSYADSRIDFVDACVVAIAERLNITQILTLDRRDFSIVRPRHCMTFELLPQGANT
ncbi:MAG: PIN domain-containing protein [Anaerolineae bacterium]|nr:PIN domain-containing protein [Anaerolineae bacterium]